jgi:predicted phosphodiesterase
MNPIAIAISDLHLSLLRPACRADKDWMILQAQYLNQVKELQRTFNPIKPLPILCAGDIFDRWNTPPELINFALEYLPDGMVCVPGQHDLPNHRLDQVHRSGYGVLSRVGKIIDISGNQTWPFQKVAHDFWAIGSGWNEEIQTAPTNVKGLKVALIHRYCWMENKCYPGAPVESNVSAFKKLLKGYQVAVFGDNHLSFTAQAGDCNVLNPGGFIRRKSDEMDRLSCVGIIYEDGTVKRRKLDTTDDVFHDAVNARPELPMNLKEFIEGLEGLGEHGLNFIQAVENHLRGEDIDPQTKEFVLKAISK